MKHISVAAVFIWFLGRNLCGADQIDDYIKEEMQKRQIPGLALGIMHRGKIVKAEEYGLANVELNVPVSRDTVFEIGSLTAQFTAAGILILMQDGKLSLEDNITAYLRNAPPAWGKITIQHLLNHTSGLRNFASQPGFELSRRLSQSQFIEKAGAWPLEFKPGDKAVASLTAYMLLGYIIENVSGKKYWDFQAERIFRPIGMDSSGDRDPHFVILRRADGYEKNKNNVLENRDYDLTDMFSAGAMVTTVSDLLRWSASLDTERILNNPTKALMWTAGKLNNGASHGFGLGCRLESYKIFQSVTQTGSTSGFSSCYQYFPQIGLCVVVLCNTGEAGTAHTLSKTIVGFYLDK